MSLYAKHKRKTIIPVALATVVICMLALIYNSVWRQSPGLASTKSASAANNQDVGRAVDTANYKASSPLDGATKSDRAANVTASPKHASANTDSQPSTSNSQPTTANAKSTIDFLQTMDDATLIDWLLTEWTESQQPNYQAPNLDQDAMTLAFAQRGSPVLQELRKQASTGRADAAHLLSETLRTCTRTPMPGCPSAPQAKAEAERVDWAAAAAGEAYPMVMLWMDSANRNDENFYRDHVATVERMRPLLLKNVQLGDCVALDWLAAFYSLNVEIAQYRQPLLSYRYRFALLHAPFASRHYQDLARQQVARAQEQIRPELLRAEEKIALALVHSSFQTDTPNCRIGRNY